MSFICPDCDGKGKQLVDLGGGTFQVRICGTCEGLGKTTHVKKPVYDKDHGPCLVCKGEKKVRYGPVEYGFKLEKCVACGGEGQIPVVIKVGR